MVSTIIQRRGRQSPYIYTVWSYEQGSVTESSRRVGVTASTPYVNPPQNVPLYFHGLTESQLSAVDGVS